MTGSEQSLIGALEPEQLAAAVARKLPRRALSFGVLLLLVLLRLYVLLALPLVVYAFVQALHTAQHAPLASKPGLAE